MKSLSVFLLVATERQTMKVFNKKRAKRGMIFTSALPGDVHNGQPPPATGSTALYWCHEKTEAALHRPIKLYQQLAGCPSALLPLHLPLCVSPPQSVLISHSNTQSFHVFRRARWHYREHLRPLTPSLTTNIYCAALIYSGLISES